MPFSRRRWDAWLDGAGDEPFEIAAADDIAMIVVNGGTTGQPKGVMLSGRNLETMSVLTLMSYPSKAARFISAGAAHARRCVLVFPNLALGGWIRDHAESGSQPVSRTDRLLSRHRYVPAADPDLDMLLQNSLA